MRKLFHISLFIICGGIIAFGFYFLKGKEKERINWFNYNVEEYTRVKADLIKFKEHENLIIDTKDLYAITIDIKDNVYVATQRNIQIFNKALKITGRIETAPIDRGLLKKDQVKSDPVKNDRAKSIDPAFCIEVDNNGVIYAGFKNDIRVFSPTGELLGTLNFRDKKTIITAICNTNSFLFVADAGTRKIHRFLKDKNNPGNLLIDDISYRFNKFIIPSAFFDIKHGLDDSLWIANTGKHALENYSLDGRLISFWTRPSITTDGFSGCCNPAHIAIASSGNIITSEKGINRIKVYSKTGDFLSVVAGSQMIGHYIQNPDIAVNSEDAVFLLDNTAKKIRIFKPI